MKKSRLLLLSVCIIASMGISAVPASAQFIGTEGEVQQAGTIHVFEYIASGVMQAEQKCELVKGTWKDNATEALLTNIAWMECTATHGTTKEAIVLECKGILLTQLTKEGVSSGSALLTFTETCFDKASATCVITIEPAGNKELSAVSLLKEAGPKVLAKVNVTGITAKSSAACQLVGISAKTNAAALEIELVQHGQGLD